MPGGSLPEIPGRQRPDFLNFVLKTIDFHCKNQSKRSKILKKNPPAEFSACQTCAMVHIVQCTRSTQGLGEGGELYDGVYQSS